MFSILCNLFAIYVFSPVENPGGLVYNKLEKIEASETGGANATSDGGSTNQQYFNVGSTPSAMTTVTYTAEPGFRFPETSDCYTTTDGITVTRTSDTVVTVSGTPNGVVSVMVPDARKPQTITAPDVSATYGDTDKKVTATSDGDGEISYAVKDGSGDYIEVDASTGALTIKKVPADGKAYVTVTATETATYEAAVKDVTVAIIKAIAVTPTVTANSRTYDGTEEPLVTVTGEVTGSAIYYALGTATEATEPYTTSIPTGNDAGTYYVWYKVEGDDNHFGSTPVCVTVTVNKADSTAATVTANNRTYDGTEKPLVTVTGEATGGTMYYAFGTTIEATEQYTTSIPTATDAGTYYVWYKVEGDDNHFGSTPVCVTVTINKADAVAATVTANSRTFDGTEKPLVTVDESTLAGGEMQYALGTDAATAPTTGYTASIPTATNAGTYYVWYKAIGDEFHLDSDPAVVTAVIAAPGGSETGEMQTLPGAPVLIDSNMADVVKSVVDAIQNGTLTDIPAEVKAALAQPGAKVTLTLISKPLADSEVPAQDKAALDAAGYDGYQPFDLSLLLTVTDPVTNEKVSTYIHVSSKGVTFSLQVPEGLKKTGRTFCLLCCHDGKVDALSSTTGDVLAGESSLFSTYAIAYQDASEPVSNTFYFKKVWEGGTKKSIDFTLYTADGKVNRQGFEKHILSEKEWSYSAVFQDAGSCYVIEKPIPGYITRYVNVGEYAGITDRCCNGGTIINKKIPKTGDETPILLLAGMLLIGASGITAALIVSKRRKARK